MGDPQIVLTQGGVDELVAAADPGVATRSRHLGPRQRRNVPHALRQGDADLDGPNPDGRSAELVERLENGEIVFTEEWSKTDEVHPLAFLVFSRLKKAGDRIIIDVDLP